MTANQVETTKNAPLGRRERKRLEIRAALTRAAFDLFAERGFDNVTVVEISERADFDPSTFFRHFGSKEAVLFTNLIDYIELVQPTLLARPADEALFDSVAATASELIRRVPFDLEQESLRVRLTAESASMHAQALVYRQMLLQHFTAAVAARLGVDPLRDPRPGFVAEIWLTAAEWYRDRALATGKPPKSGQKAIDETLKLIRQHVRVIGVDPD